MFVNTIFATCYLTKYYTERWVRMPSCKTSEEYLDKFYRKVEQNYGITIRKNVKMTIVTCSIVNSFTL